MPFPSVFYKYLFHLSELPLIRNDSNEMVLKERQNVSRVKFKPAAAAKRREILRSSAPYSIPLEHVACESRDLVSLARELDEDFDTEHKGDHSPQFSLAIKTIAETQNEQQSFFQELIKKLALIINSAHWEQDHCVYLNVSPSGIVINMRECLSMGEQLPLLTLYYLRQIADAELRQPAFLYFFTRYDALVERFYRAFTKLQFQKSKAGDKPLQFFESFNRELSSISRQLNPVPKQEDNWESTAKRLSTSGLEPFPDNIDDDIVIVASVPGEESKCDNDAAPVGEQFKHSLRLARQPIELPPTAAGNLVHLTQPTSCVTRTVVNGAKP